MQRLFSMRLGAALAAALAATLMASCGGSSSTGTTAPIVKPPVTEPDNNPVYSLTEKLADWPHITSSIKKDTAMEANIAAIVKDMTVNEKVGQMIQAEIGRITPDEVKQYYIGSVLNGGGTWPTTADANKKHASAADWVALADQLWVASMATDSKVKIPVMWGTDAIHGHNNVYGATLFPHNIGLGAANNPDLIKRIGEATATQIAATGIDWTFAPTLAVVRDDRWGRTYEGYSENPQMVSAYASAMVKGLQGDFARTDSTIPTVIATAKHFLGDGGTDQGDDQGVNMSSEIDMINTHGWGYYSALGAGVQTVMVSFSSWKDADYNIDYGKMHGNKKMLTEVLKNKMGFDGLVISDWNGFAQLAGCSNTSCPQAINAGIDMIMVPADWKKFIENTITQVNTGVIPMARIDDAVTRVLRVKMRAGLFAAKKPSERLGASVEAKLHQRALAREAVQKSLVLLKNKDQVLPLYRGKKILVVGKSADSLPNQTGGWTLTWQGCAETRQATCKDLNTNADFLNADSILAGIREAAGAENVVFKPTVADIAGVNLADYETVIAVIGEKPYAEGDGDIDGKYGTLEHARNYPEDLAVLKAVSGQNAKVVTVFVTGRPLMVNSELNRSDAFVVAWLPGTEGKGIADVLFRNAEGAINAPITGKLSYSWPKSACQVLLNVGSNGYDPLFAYGFGLEFKDNVAWVALDETTRNYGCGETPPPTNIAKDELILFSMAGQPSALFPLSIVEAANWGDPKLIGANESLSITNLTVTTSQFVLGGVSETAKKVTWSGKGLGTDEAQFYAKNDGVADLYGYINADSALVFDTVVHQKPVGAVTVRLANEWPDRAEVPGTALFNHLALETPTRVKVPLSCFDIFEKFKFTEVKVPFLLTTTNAFVASFANIRWIPNAGKDADALKCADLK